MDTFLNLLIGWSCYNFLCILIFCLVCFKHRSIKKNQLLLLFVVVYVIIAVFGNAITMDYRAYWKIIQQIIYGSQRYIHLEDIYKWLIEQFTKDNYVLWQAVIYCPAYIIFYKIVKKYMPNVRMTIFLFAFTILVFYYDCIGSRQFLFIVLYYWGIVLCVNRHRLLGLCILALSVIFHKMAYMAIPLLILYRISLKGKIWLYSSLIFVLIFIVRCLLLTHIDLLTVYLAPIGGISYLSTDTSGEVESGSVWWRIIAVYSNFVKILLLFFCLFYMRNIVKGKDALAKVMYSIVYWTTMLSLFFNNIGLSNGTISYRLLSIGSIAFCYLFSLLPCYTNKWKAKKILIVLLMFVYYLFTNAYIKGVSNSVMLGELQLE